MHFVQMFYILCIGHKFSTFLILISHLNVYLFQLLSLPPSLLWYEGAAGARPCLVHGWPQVDGILGVLDHFVVSRTFNHFSCYMLTGSFHCGSTVFTLPLGCDETFKNILNVVLFYIHVFYIKAWLCFTAVVGLN